ncbi:hypothetical protein J437_LFUL000439 [Ladona fulva]|uniref:Uncharacterized protein n=1 Tax=Ladona fulva TaxID=123851 RepID=A0A8K0K528_LADFU|nr:hypothetical protein J437_LFUL000439 [Ladona fulva]
MPSGLGTSYRSLADDVYRSTTVAENKFSVIDSVKKAFSFNTSPARRTDTVILHTDVEQSEEPTAIISSCIMSIGTTAGYDFKPLDSNLILTGGFPSLRDCYTL